MDANKKILQKNWVVVVLACMCCILWGSAFPSIKFGYRLFQIGSGQAFSQILFAGCRFTLAGFLVILISSCLKRKVLVPKKGSGKMIFHLSLIQTAAQYFFFYIGLAHTTGVKGSIINGSASFLTILIACLIFRYEKLTWKKLLACVIGFAGVIIVNFDPNGFGTSISFLGEGFVLLSSLSYAFSSIFIKKYSQMEDPVILSGYQFMLGGLFMCVVGFLAGGRLHPTTPMAFLLLLYMAGISAVAYTVWGILLKYNPVGKVSIFNLTTPIFGVILSAIILGEGSQVPFVNTAIALVLVCVGIFMVNVENSK